MPTLRIPLYIQRISARLPVRFTQRLTQFPSFADVQRIWRTHSSQHSPADNTDYQRAGGFWLERAYTRLTVAAHLPTLPPTGF